MGEAPHSCPALPHVSQQVQALIPGPSSRIRGLGTGHPPKEQREAAKDEKRGVSAGGERRALPVQMARADPQPPQGWR